MASPLTQALDGHEAWLRDHSTALTGLHERIEHLERIHSVSVFQHWITHARLNTSPLVSVIMPTHNRCAYLPAAIASVQAQTYPHWELVIVDDASADSTAALLSTVDDPRVRSIRVPHGGCCAARNAGLEVATGELIAYLDDDNTMHATWLRSVVWAFEQRPDVDVLYGAVLLDDLARAERRGSGSMPALFLRPFDRNALRTENLTDMGAIAHRAGLPGAHFDESLREMGDWDLLCTLTADRDPLMLPAIACCYTTDAPTRLSGGPTHTADRATVLAKHRLA